MRVKSGFKIIISIMFVILIISSLSLFIGKSTLNKIYIDTKSFEGLKTSRTDSHNKILWVVNPTFEDPVDPWFSSIDGDTSDAITSTSPNQANMQILGEEYEKEVLLNSATISEWEAFNKSDLALVPQRSDVPYYGLDSDGAWCSHLWWEGTPPPDGQPKNTPEMHWRTNVSLTVDMSDYIITSVDFSAIIFANVSADNVNSDIDTPGDTWARWIPSQVAINQEEKFDYAQFYVEITTLDIDELNTYRIAFNQTRMLGNEGLSLYDIEGLIGAYEEQAIIDALTNVLAVDPGHNNFTVVLGIYMYCEDNLSSTDRDDWFDMRFKTLNMTFSYVKKIDQSTAISWNQELDAINGSNVRVTAANLNFKFKIDQNWTEASQNSRFLVYINDRKYNPAISLIDYVYSPDFQEARIGGYDIVSKILPYESFNLTIQVFLAEDFGLEQDITISITNVTLYISYTETFPDPPSIISEPWFFSALLAIVSVATVCLGGYFIAYQRVLKYPKPVRKVRKFKRTLNKSSAPDVHIMPREVAFKKSYNKELSGTSKALRLKAGTPRATKVVEKFKKKPEPAVETKIDSDQLIKTSLEKKSELDKIVDKSVDKNT